MIAGRDQKGKIRAWKAKEDRNACLACQANLISTISPRTVSNTILTVDLTSLPPCTTSRAQAFRPFDNLGQIILASDCSCCVFFAPSSTRHDCRRYQQTFGWPPLWPTRPCLMLRGYDRLLTSERDANVAEIDRYVKDGWPSWVDRQLTARALSRPTAQLHHQTRPPRVSPLQTPQRPNRHPRNHQIRSISSARPSLKTARKRRRQPHKSKFARALPVLLSVRGMARKRHDLRAQLSVLKRAWRRGRIER